MGDFKIKKVGRGGLREELESSGQGAAHQPWVQKYRPRTIDEVVHQTEIISNLRKLLVESTEDVERGMVSFTHLLFHGPPGTGKTTTILAVCRQLFGPEYMDSRVRELNASDERGIETVRNKVKRFASQSVSKMPKREQKDGKTYPVPPFKVIILDEADALAHDAQAALRRLMEDYAGVTRFCIICNYVTRIIDPIASRCAKYRFKALDEAPMTQRLQYISEREELKVDPESLKKLHYVAAGDLRLAITYLQAAERMHGKDLSEVNFFELGGCIPEHLVAEFLQTIQTNNFESVEGACRGLVDQGYSVTKLFRQLSDSIAGSPEEEFNTIAKSCMLIKMHDSEKALVDGSSEFLQLLGWATYSMQVVASAVTVTATPMDCN